MRHIFRSILFCLLALASGAACADGYAADDDLEAFREAVAALVNADDAPIVVQGRSNWLFLLPELRHLTAGRFWGEHAAAASRATRPEWADPLPAIVDFKQQCTTAGARLIFVPIPPKAVIYPEKLPNSPFESLPAGRLDTEHAEFYAQLREAGVEILDLTPVFLEYRRKHADNPDAPLLYCRQDTHWTPTASRLAAELIAERLADIDFSAVETRQYARVEEMRTINGDLRQMLDDAVAADIPMETLSAAVVRDAATGAAPGDWRDSPVLCVGDSHLLVFHSGGELHGEGAGLADHLAADLGFPVDVVGVRGSGATPSRLALFRRRDSLASKKAVIWCMTAREFTQTQGWRPVPVVR